MTPDLRCLRCGSNRFAYPASSSDETPIFCEDCGRRVGTLAEWKESMAQSEARAAPPAG